MFQAAAPMASSARIAASEMRADTQSGYRLREASETKIINCTIHYILLTFDINFQAIPALSGGSSLGGISLGAGVAKYGGMCAFCKTASTSGLAGCDCVKIYVFAFSYLRTKLYHLKAEARAPNPPQSS